MHENSKNWIKKNRKWLNLLRLSSRSPNLSCIDEDNKMLTHSGCFPRRKSQKSKTTCTFIKFAPAKVHVACSVSSEQLQFEKKKKKPKGGQKRKWFSRAVGWVFEIRGQYSC